MYVYVRIPSCIYTFLSGAIWCVFVSDNALLWRIFFEVFLLYARALVSWESVTIFYQSWKFLSTFPFFLLSSHVLSFLVLSCRVLSCLVLSSSSHFLSFCTWLFSPTYSHFFLTILVHFFFKIYSPSLFLFPPHTYALYLHTLYFIIMYLHIFYYTHVQMVSS